MQGWVQRPHQLLRDDGPCGVRVKRGHRVLQQPQFVGVRLRDKVWPVSSHKEGMRTLHDDALLFQ